MAIQFGVGMVNRSDPVPEGPVLKGYLSRTKEAPKTFKDPMWVVIPDYPEAPLLCNEWGAIHGNTLPAQGTSVTVVVDNDGIPTVVGWKGEHT